MKKNGLFLTFLLLLAMFSYAQDFQNKYLYIEGTASRPDHQDFFLRSFVMEANGSGYEVTNYRDAATHTLRFRVVTDSEPYDPYAYDPYGYDEYEYEYMEQYVITMSLHRNSDNSQLISFDFAFSTIEEMYPFVRTLFLNSVTSIPLPLLTEQFHWNKWIYFRASFDYPVTFYVLQSTGLKGGIGLYNNSPERVSPISHEIMAMPGATLGVEFQFLNFLCLELNFQMSMGDTRNNYFVNMGAGAEAKVPVKFRNVMLVPYGAFLYSFKPSPIFSDFPPFMVGGGIQVCARAGKRGILFLDTKFMFALTDAVMRNPYLDFPANQQLYPEPAGIHYKRSYLGIGVGYKIGILDRPRREANIRFRF